MQFVQNYSIMHLSYLFYDENNAFNFAVQKNMIYNILNCNDCGIQLKIYKDKYKKISYYFKCTKCKRVYSILYQSIFYRGICIDQFNAWCADNSGDPDGSM